VLTLVDYLKNILKGPFFAAREKHFFAHVLFTKGKKSQSPGD